MLRHLFSLIYNVSSESFFPEWFWTSWGKWCIVYSPDTSYTWYTCTWLEKDVMVPLKPPLSLNPVGLLIVKWNAHVSLCKANSISPRHHLMTRAMKMLMRINSQSLDSGHNDEALMIRSGWWHNAFSILFSYFFLSPKFRWEILMRRSRWWHNGLFALLLRQRHLRSLFLAPS